MEIRTCVGHDSTDMKDFVPSVMLVIPSGDGKADSELSTPTDRDPCHGVSQLAKLPKRISAGALMQPMPNGGDRYTIRPQKRSNAHA